MNNRPSSIRVFGSSLVADPYSPQFRAYRYGGEQPYVPPKPIDPDAPQCGADDCDALTHAKGYCDLHYRRLVTYGTPYAPDRRRKEHRK